MNDYLSTIASRTALLELTLRPRRSASFEGASGRFDALRAGLDVPRAGVDGRALDAGAHGAGAHDAGNVRDEGSVREASAGVRLQELRLQERRPFPDYGPVDIPSGAAWRLDAPLDGGITSRSAAVPHGARDAGDRRVAHPGGISHDMPDEGVPQVGEAIAPSTIEPGPTAASPMTSFATPGTDAAPVNEVSRTAIVATVNAGDRIADVRSMHDRLGGDRRGGDRPDGVIENGASAPKRAAAVAPRIEAARASMREAEPVHPSEPTMRSLPIDPLPVDLLRAPRPAASTRPALEPARTARSAPAPEPTVVHVTIGRIDVRAVPPPPAPRPQPSAARSASPMSLEEYLSGKTRGTR